MSVAPVIVIHGGAGAHSAIRDDKIAAESLRNGVLAAAKAGYYTLLKGGSAVDAVEAAVMSMENNESFNAGLGSCLTIDGTLEMDASIMDGKTLNCGAVALISNVSNPVHVARLVMDKSDHCLLGGNGAQTFAKTQGIPFVPTEKLVTETSRRRLQTLQSFSPSVRVEFDRNKLREGAVVDDSHDTVGAVALDVHGNVAYATSTGGINAKMSGRVGDCPLVGAGGYSDNTVGAISTTGHGESFIKMCTAKHICTLMETGMGIKEAMKRCLDNMESRVGGQGGAVGVDIQGNVAVDFTTPGMCWCSIKDNHAEFGIYKGDDYTAQVKLTH